MYDRFMGIDLSRDGHSTVTWEQLTNWQSCREWGNFTAKPYLLQGAWQAPPPLWRYVRSAQLSTTCLLLDCPCQLGPLPNPLTRIGPGN